ncbi:DUF4340 domain-containing protein [Desulfatibacillum aliphaticivorans]|uniref:DUF4340 domain-containing protein n=1 Tax=Desulfatibacillum aliphaticivorans TaxID=218208 RepID=UPI0004295481|nr:DUF4340 domain-containing protein [Desulfatibacillum aliphaticivorans]
MNKKTIIKLIATLAGLAVITAVTMYFNAPGGEETAMGQPLFQDLDINAVTSIKVETPEQTFTLVKNEDGWGLAERGNYPADFDKVARFGRKLTALTVGRAFRYDADVLARLSLKLPSTLGSPAEEKGALFTLTDKNDNEVAKILVGKDRTKETPEGYPMPAGQFVRMGDMKDVYLVDRYFEAVDQKPSDWLKKAILKVPSDQVASVTCMEVNEGRQKVIYELSRKNPGQDFSLSSQAPVKKADADKLADALSSLTLEDVRPVGDNEAHQGPFLDFWLFDGTKYRVYKAPVGEGCEVRIEISHMAPVTADGKDEDDAKAKEVEDLNKKLAPWAFKLSDWRCGTLATSEDSLIEQEKEEQ